MIKKISRRIVKDPAAVFYTSWMPLIIRITDIIV